MGKTTNSSTTSAKASKKEKSVKHRVLMAIASQRVLGKLEVEKKQIIALASITNTHTFDTNCASMKKKGLIEQVGSCLKLTDKGMDEIGGEDAIIGELPQTNDDIQTKLKEQIKHKRAHLIFDLLTDGKAYTRAEIAEKLGWEQNKTFQTYMSYLSKVVDKVGEGGKKIQLKDEAFPFGRPCGDESKE